MTFSEFDEATPRMVQLHIIAFGQRSEERQQQLTIAAYHGVGFWCAANSESGLTHERLRQALFGDKPKDEREADAEFDRRADAMGSFFDRILSSDERARQGALAAQEQH
jgi:hypothetical protein